MSTKASSGIRTSRRNSSLLEPQMTPALEDVIRQTAIIAQRKLRLGKFRRQIGLDTAWNEMIRACMTLTIVRKPQGWRPSPADIEEMERSGIAGRSPPLDPNSEEFMIALGAMIRWAMNRELLFWRRLPNAKGDGPDYIAPFDVLKAEPYDPWDVRLWAYDDQKGADVIAMAWRGNPIAQGVLSEIARHFQQEGSAPPPNLWQYLVDLTDNRRLPKKQISKTAQRDLDIVVLTNEVVRATGLQRDAQPAARKRPPPTAYWVVQCALAANDIHLSVPLIRKAWDRYGALGKSIAFDPLDYELVGRDGIVIINLRATWDSADECFVQMSPSETSPQAPPVLQNDFAK